MSPVVHEHVWSEPVFGTEYAPNRWLRWCVHWRCQMPGGRHRTVAVTATPDWPEEWFEEWRAAASASAP